MTEQPIKWFSRALNEIRNADMRAGTGENWMGLFNSLQQKGRVKNTELDYLGLNRLDPSQRYTKDSFDEMEGWLPTVNRVIAGQDFPENPRPGRPTKVLYENYPSYRTPYGRNYREHVLYSPEADRDDGFDYNHFGNHGPEGQQLGWLRMQDSGISHGNRHGVIYPFTILDEVQSNRTEDSPFNKDWQNLLFRAGLWDAADRDNSGLAAVTSAEQKRRWGRTGTSTDKLYDTLFPKFAKNELTRLGGDPGSLTVHPSWDPALGTDPVRSAQVRLRRLQAAQNQERNPHPDHPTLNVMPLDNRLKDLILTQGLPLFQKGGSIKTAQISQNMQNLRTGIRPR